MIPRRTLLAGLAATAGATRAQAAGTTPITLAVSSNSLAYGGLRIASGAGLFEKNGITLSISVMESGSAATTAVLSGSIQFCSASLGEVLAARVHGQKLVVLANIYRGLSGSLVLARPVVEKIGLLASAPLDARLKALDGLTVATPSATSSYTLPFRLAGQATGALPRFVYMSQPAMLAALRTGAVQGMIAGAPFSTEAVAGGAGTMWVNGPAGDLPDEIRPTSSAAIETSEAYAVAHSDVVDRMRRSFSDLTVLLRERPAEAQRLLAAAYPQLSADTISSIYLSDSRNWGRPDMTVADIRHEIALQARVGLLKGVEGVDPASVLAA